MPIYDVRHLGLCVGDEPIVEYDPDNPDGQHVVSLFRGHLLNYWHREMVDDETGDLLHREVQQQRLARQFP